MTVADDENDGQATERVVIRDRRKIDSKAEPKDAVKAKGKASVGGAHRAADPEEVTEAEPEEPKPAVNAELEALRSEFEERTHDLQR